MIEQLLEAYNKAVTNKDDFAITMIYTRIRNLGYDLVTPDKH